MIVEYSHKRYELDGSVNTDNYGAHFLMTRKTIEPYQPPIPPHAQKRFVDRIQSVGTLNQFEVIYSDDIIDTESSLSLPRIAITGSIILEDPMTVLDRTPPNAFRALRVPMTPEYIERTMAEGALHKCAHFLVSEFEGIMVPRAEK